MIGNLLNKLGTVKIPVTAFDGLGSSTSAWSDVYTDLPCRIRQLYAREQFNAQGDNLQATHRVYFDGSITTYVQLKKEVQIEIDDKAYRVLTVNQARTLADHHLQVDVREVEGVS